MVGVKSPDRTDLEELPDYEEGPYYHHRGQARGAPVDAKGNPIFYEVPERFEEAENDGERWRWCLMMSAKASPTQRPYLQNEFAQFLYHQFGVQTLQQLNGFHGWFGRSGFGVNVDEADRQNALLDLPGLEAKETVARLANGVKRFTLPDEFAYIKIYEELAQDGEQWPAENALNTLADIYSNRMQYAKAAEAWSESIRRFGDSKHEHKQKALEQIVNNWGRFEPGKPLPAGEQAVLQYRFRNGAHLALEAHSIKIDLLLEDAKAYLKSNPKKLDSGKMDLQRIGMRLIDENQGRYLGARVAEWELELEPRKHHFDRLIEVETPLKDAGAYLVKASMEEGNTSHVVVWLADTVIAQKRLDNEVMYYVADAVTGEPVEKANVEFFGYDIEHIRNNLRQALGRQIEVRTDQFAEFTDENGILYLSPEEQKRDHQWLVIARKGERLAYLGFQRVWYSNHYDQEYRATKALVITDRPVYRPNQSVKFKAWVRQAKYDQEDVSAFADRSYTVRIRDAKNEKVYEQAHRTDAYGGLDGEFVLPPDAALGNYHLEVVSVGGNNFRVEEYKKPEFEVLVDAPSEPVMLGDTIEATIRAKYYFGAPVTEATLKYKVMRQQQDTAWYPVGRWDWFYGRGYWWFGVDYPWYPGFMEWGCFAPSPWWWHRPAPQPEIVADGEVDIGPDGSYQLKIDTSLAKAIHGDNDHNYSITAEVVDQSRRTIVGTGRVLAAREPYRVYAWVDRGYYTSGDTAVAGFSARTPDGQPVTDGKAEIKLMRIQYNRENQPRETIVERWQATTGATGSFEQKFVAAKPGQYRVAATVSDSKGRVREGGYIFNVRGQHYQSGDYRFNNLELIPDKKEYAPGEKVQLAINSDSADATVLLFIRPANGVYLRPRVLRLEGKSLTEAIEITKKDMPNFFVEALTVGKGDVHTLSREIIVPPEKRVLHVDVLPSKESYKPGEPAKVKISVTDFDGEPYVGSTVVSVYDKSVEYISGGSNVPEIKEFFWKWRRNHNSHTFHSLSRYFPNLVERNEQGMGNLGIFGGQVATLLGSAQEAGLSRVRAGGDRSLSGGIHLDALAAPMASASLSMKSADMAWQDGDAMVALAESSSVYGRSGGGFGNYLSNQASGGEKLVEATVRKNFADTAFWTAALTTDANGEAEIELEMPENLTTWKIRTWAMGHGTKVGEGSTEVLTTKNLIIRLQAPRFFVEKDEVVLSANVHNYLDSAKEVTVALELGGQSLQLMEGVESARKLRIEANGEARVDWRVQVVREGEVAITMKALTDEESDAMQMDFPVKVHGIDKFVAFSGHLPPDENRHRFTIKVPADRRIDTGRLEIRYSPTLAGAMVDALPYLLEFPYGCTEQTLNRFLPAAITQKVLLDMELDLEDIRQKKSNLNAQEIGEDQARARQWAKQREWTHDAEGNRIPYNPVFDEAKLEAIVKAGVKRLTAQQLSDGGWGWFSGYGEHSSPHTTATVVRGLLVARDNDVALVPGTLERGIDWLAKWQKEQIRLLKRGEGEDPESPYRSRIGNLDAYVFYILTEAGQKNDYLHKRLYEERNELAVYTKSMLGMAYHQLEDLEKRDMLIRNIEQYLVKDPENQTAYLNLGNRTYWWYWYGSEYEAHAFYLKLLALTDPKSETAPWLVKYLLNNRKHASNWNSTRDTALVVEAFADYIRATGEDKPELDLEIYIDGEKHKDVRITGENLFTFDNQLLLTGDALSTGEHRVEFRKKGRGPIYFNAYLSYFSLEDPIEAAGLEIKVERHYYKLNAIEKTSKVAGSRGQAVDQRVEKYERVKLDNLDRLNSGDLVEIELVVESKNDYEYIILEDWKAAGFEPVDVRSGYINDGMRAYRELRDDRVSFFLQKLARGKHSLSYRMRAEIPGKFSALPTQVAAMYAPELKANASEIKLRIEDAE